MPRPSQVVSQDARVQPDEQLRAVDVTDQPFKVGDVLPMRLLATDMRRIFGIGPARFYALVHAGTFDAFEILPKIGPRAWSGERVSAYLKGDAFQTRTFGRKARG